MRRKHHNPPHTKCRNSHLNYRERQISTTLWETRRWKTNALHTIQAMSYNNDYRRHGKNVNPKKSKALRG